MTIYIKFDNIQGDVTHKQYKGYSVVQSMHLPGIHNGAQNQVGSSSYHQGGTPQFAPIQIIKPIDGITPNIFAAACNGHVYNEVTIVEAGTHADETITPFLVTTLKNVRVADYSRAHQGQGGHPKEMMSLTYSSISERLSGKHTNGSQQTSKAVGFDLEKIRGL
jgi:type VI secretion system Hcp family effector